MRLSRRHVISAGAAIAAPAIALEAPRHSRRMEPDVTRAEITVPSLHPDHDGLRVVHLTDIHVGMSTPDELVLRAIAIANHAEPDLVMITGDFVTRGRGPIERIPEVLAGIKAPTFANLGNHDHWAGPRAVRRKLEGLGYVVLQNEHTVYRFRGRDLAILGVDDGMTRNDDVEETFRGTPSSGSKLVMIHTPRTADKLPPDRGLFVLAGHTHGGQVVVPFVTFALLRGLLRENYIRGRYQVNGNELYVGRGVGMTGPSFRVGASSEVGIFTLRAPKTA
jgi:predicted MPP superfamily phosphohydrolase